MAGLVDYRITRLEDNTLTLSLTTQAAIGGMEIEFSVAKHFGGEPFIKKSMSSGFYGVSGLSIVNSGNGTMRASMYDSEFSGRGDGNYAVMWRRLDSGHRKVINAGYATRALP